MKSFSKDRPEAGVSALVAYAERGLIFLSGIALAAIMLVVVTDVTMRYVLQSPLGWSYDLIGTYLMVCVFFFALSDTMHQHGHISIDFFAHSLPRRFTHASLALGYGLSTAVLAMIVWQAWYRTDAAFSANSLIRSTVPWPTWPSYFMLCVGSALITLRCGLRTVAHAASFVTGREIADMPPPPNTALSGTERGE